MIRRQTQPVVTRGRETFRILKTRPDKACSVTIRFKYDFAREPKPNAYTIDGYA